MYKRRGVRRLTEQLVASQKRTLIDGVVPRCYRRNLQGRTIDACYYRRNLQGRTLDVFSIFLTSKFARFSCLNRPEAMN
jgi:hypothetical protein